MLEGRENANLLKPSIHTLPLEDAILGEGNIYAVEPLLRHGTVFCQKNGLSGAL